MAAYKEPGLDERRAAAAAAREKALEKLKARAPVDPVVRAERIAAAEARENAKAEKREAIKARKVEELAQKAQVSASMAPAPEPSEGERKAARDAKYAARKARKK
jgi:hypothetical protein